MFTIRQGTMTLIVLTLENVLKCRLFKEYVDNMKVYEIIT